MDTSVLKLPRKIVKLARKARRMGAQPTFDDKMSFRLKFGEDKLNFFQTIAYVKTGKVMPCKSWKEVEGILEACDVHGVALELTRRWWNSLEHFEKRELEVLRLFEHAITPPSVRFNPGRS